MRSTPRPCVSTKEKVCSSLLAAKEMRLYTAEDLERLEVILHLTRELGVNLAGVEIVLNMREKMAQMQAQIEEFVATLNHELVAHRRPPEPQEKQGLMRVIKWGPAISSSPKNR